MNSTANTHGYYRLAISPRNKGILLRTNGERAFVMSLLQDLLSPRLLLIDTPAHHQLTSCVDLLSFSITKTDITLLIFSVSKEVSVEFLRLLAAKLSLYDNGIPSGRPCADITTSLRILDGAHHALSESLCIHHLHFDWEADRYSSIGFYLHDRRGDWMRLWRLTQLYGNNPETYYELMRHRLPYTKRQQLPIARQSFPLLAS